MKLTFLRVEDGVALDDMIDGFLVQIQLGATNLITSLIIIIYKNIA